MVKKIAMFRFEASNTIGAGHAIRSCVIADALVENGWECFVVTSSETVNFIKNLNRFRRVDADQFYKCPIKCDLLVIDNYEVDEEYEKKIRYFAKKIMVIDDLANRKHNCDILLDQTYGRDFNDYKKLVPKTCNIVVGSDYILLRKEFLDLRAKALEKRRKTTQIKRILISFGGSDPKNYTLKALKIIKKLNFQGSVDIALGFASNNYKIIKDYIGNIKNKCTIYIDANMPKLIYEADLVIGAAGSSVWERCCLGVPQYVFKTAENQNKIVDLFRDDGAFEKGMKTCSFSNSQYNMQIEVDGLGVYRILSFIDYMVDIYGNIVYHIKIKYTDSEQIYNWQKDTEIRKNFVQKEISMRDEHDKWFIKQVNSIDIIFEKIICNKEACGVIRLEYIRDNDHYNFNWYVIPTFQKQGIETIVIYFAKKLARNKKIKTFVIHNDITYKKALQKVGFFAAKTNEERGIWYEY